MKFDVWLDFVCPYCYLGKYRLLNAVRLAEISEPIEFIYHSYELNPRARRNTRKTLAQQLADQHGIGLETAEDSLNDLTEQARELGLEYHLDTAIPTNTHDAHRILQFIQERDPAAAGQFVERAFKAHLTDSLDIGDPGLIADIAVDCGMNRSDVLDVLVTDQYEPVVREDMNRAREMQVQGVPYFIINDQYSVSGAQPVRVFARILKNLEEASA